MMRHAKFLATLATGGLATALTQVYGLDPEIAGAVVVIVSGAAAWLTPNKPA